MPYPRSELTPAAIARAVVTQYFLPIVRGDLVVEIRHPDDGERVINAETIGTEVGRIEDSERDDESPESLRRIIELTRWALNTNPAEHINTAVPSGNIKSLGDLNLEEIRQRYDRGEPLAFHLTMSVRPRTGQGNDSAGFRVYLQRADDLLEGHDYFVRGHLRIPQMDHIKRHRARALVLVEGESDLGHMLRDAEGPAHTSWDPFAQRLVERWIGGQTRVRTVRHAAQTLLQRLAERPDEQQLDALADLFPDAPERGGGKTQPSIEPPVAQHSRLNVGRNRNGFSVRGGSEPDMVGTKWRLRFAYDVVRGSAFTHFETGLKQGCPDFSLVDGELQVDSAHCDVDVIGDIALEFQVSGVGFRLTVAGFDDRDVVVDLKLIDAVAGELAENAA